MGNTPYTYHLHIRDNKTENKNIHPSPERNFNSQSKRFKNGLKPNRFVFYVG
jgi:hypothetical protein